MTNPTYTVFVNCEGNIQTALDHVSYTRAHEFAARAAANGMSVDIIQHSHRPGVPDVKCCASYHGELVSCLKTETPA